MLSRLKQYFRARPTAAPAGPVSVRAFKEAAWQTREAAAKYVEGTRVPSHSMLCETAVVLEYAGGVVLDVGAGTGRFSRAMAERGLRVVAVDLSAEMLKAGRSLSASRYDCAIASGFCLPFADASFDTVTSLWLFVHFDEWRDLLGELLRVARPGGRVVFEIQNALNYEHARGLAPDAEFVERVKTPAGYHAFATAEEVAAAALDADVELARFYDVFTDNFVAQATLGERYASWIEEVNAALADENCRRYWLDVNLGGLAALPAFVARKQMIVLRKRDESDGAPAPVAASAATRFEWTEEVERSRALFREAFGPIGVELPSPTTAP